MNVKCELGKWLAGAASQRKNAGVLHSFGCQPMLHRESIIVLLPKEGKDIKDISENGCNAAAGKVL